MEIELIMSTDLDWTLHNYEYRCSVMCETNIVILILDSHI